MKTLIKYSFCALLLVSQTSYPLLGFGSSKTEEIKALQKALNDQNEIMKQQIEIAQKQAADTNKLLAILIAAKVQEHQAHNHAIQQAKKAAQDAQTEAEEYAQKPAYKKILYSVKNTAENFIFDYFVPNFTHTCAQLITRKAILQTFEFCDTTLEKAAGVRPFEWLQYTSAELKALQRKRNIEQTYPDLAEKEDQALHTLLRFQTSKVTEAINLYIDSHLPAKDFQEKHPQAWHDIHYLQPTIFALLDPETKAKFIQHMNADVR